jgi:hypothetical protein
MYVAPALHQLFPIPSCFLLDGWMACIVATHSLFQPSKDLKSREQRAEWRRKEMSGQSIIPDVIDERKKRLRGGRFKDHLNDGYKEADNEPDESGPGAGPKSPKRIKGLSTRIEKPYFRLTSAPKVSQVRPLAVLKKSLSHVKKKYMEDEDYSYCCEQVSE